MDSVGGRKDGERSCFGERRLLSQIQIRHFVSASFDGAELIVRLGMSLRSSEVQFFPGGVAGREKAGEASAGPAGVPRSFLLPKQLRYGNRGSRAQSAPCRAPSLPHSSLPVPDAKLSSDVASPSHFTRAILRHCPRLPTSLSETGPVLSPRCCLRFVMVLRCKLHQDTSPTSFSCVGQNTPGEHYSNHD